MLSEGGVAVFYKVFFSSNFITGSNPDCICRMKIPTDAKKSAFHALALAQYYLNWGFFEILSSTITARLLVAASTFPDKVSRQDVSMPRDHSKRDLCLLTCASFPPESQYFLQCPSVSSLSLSGLNCAKSCFWKKHYFCFWLVKMPYYYFSLPL